MTESKLNIAKETIEYNSLIVTTSCIIQHPELVNNVLLTVISEEKSVQEALITEETILYNIKIFYLLFSIILLVKQNTNYTTEDIIKYYRNSKSFESNFIDTIISMSEAELTLKNIKEMEDYFISSMNNVFKQEHEI